MKVSMSARAKKKRDPCQTQACEIQKCLEGELYFPFNTFKTKYSRTLMARTPLTP